MPGFFVRNLSCTLTGGRPSEMLLPHLARVSTFCCHNLRKIVVMLVGSLPPSPYVLIVTIVISVKQGPVIQCCTS